MSYHERYYRDNDQTAQPNSYQHGTGAGPVHLLNGELLAQGGLWRRFFARFLDGFIVYIPLWIIYTLFGINVWGEISGTELILTSLIGAIVYAIYEIRMLASSGQTLGKKAAGIIVVNYAEGSLPSSGAAFQRWFLYGVAGTASGLFGQEGPGVFWAALLGLFTLLVLISPLFDGQRRGWHDKFANTVVIRV